MYPLKSNSEVEQRPTFVCCLWPVTASTGFTAWVNKALYLSLSFNFDNDNDNDNDDDDGNGNDNDNDNNTQFCSCSFGGDFQPEDSLDGQVSEEVSLFIFVTVQFHQLILELAQ